MSICEIKREIDYREPSLCNQYAKWNRREYILRHVIRKNRYRGGVIMQKIGVEGSLTNIHQALREKGYDVVELNSGTDMQNMDCCVRIRFRCRCNGNARCSKQRFGY